MACAPPFFLQTGTQTQQQDGFYTVACSWIHPDPLPDYFTIWIYHVDTQAWVVQGAFQGVTGLPGSVRLAALVGLNPGGTFRWWVQSICFGGAEASPFIEGPTVVVQQPFACLQPTNLQLGAGIRDQGDGFFAKTVSWIVPNPSPTRFLLSSWYQDPIGSLNTVSIVTEWPIQGPFAPGSIQGLEIQGCPPNQQIFWNVISECFNPADGLTYRATPIGGQPFNTPIVPQPGPLTELALVGAIVQQQDGFYTQNVQWRIPALSPDSLVYYVWANGDPVVFGFVQPGPFNAGNIMPGQLVGLPPSSNIQWADDARYNSIGDFPANGPVFTTPAAVGIVKHRGESFGANLAFNYQGRQATLNLSMIAVHHGGVSIPGTTVFLDVPNSITPQPFQRALSILISNELPVGIYDALVRISEVGGSVLYETTFPNTWEVI